MCCSGSSSLRRSTPILLQMRLTLPLPSPLIPAQLLPIYVKCSVPATGCSHLHKPSTLVVNGTTHVNSFILSWPRPPTEFTIYCEYMHTCMHTVILMYRPLCVQHIQALHAYIVLPYILICVYLYISCSRTRHCTRDVYSTYKFCKHTPAHTLTECAVFGSLGKFPCLSIHIYCIL